MMSKKTWVRYVWLVSYTQCESVLFDTEEDALEFISEREKLDKTELEVKDNKVFKKNDLIIDCRLLMKDVWRMKQLS